ncbi:MAG: GNAT family N-acetyltransferase [Kangiellaceae bacterium]
MDNQKNNLRWEWKTLAEMTGIETEKMFSLRQDIFVIEQDCLYADIDGKDSKAHHLLVWDKNNLVATLRVFESYQEYDNRASIGRVCVATSARKYGIGNELVQNAIDFIQEHFVNKEIQIGAQLYLKFFYLKLGFRQVSDVYDEDGIDHILMRL